MRRESSEIAHARFGRCSHTCFADALLVLSRYSAARTTQAAGLLRNDVSQRSTPHIYPRLLRRVDSSASHSSDPASRHSVSSGAFYHELFGEAPVQNSHQSSASHSSDPASRHSVSSGAFYHELFGEAPVQNSHRSSSQHSASPSHRASSTGAAAGSKDSRSAYMRAASAAEKAAPELFDEVTSRPADQKRPRPVLSEEEKRQRRTETTYRARLRAKGLVVPAAPGYADRTGTHRGKRLTDKDLPSIPVLPLTVRITRAGRQRAKDGVQGSGASSATKSAAAGSSAPGSSQLPSPPHAGTERAAGATAQVPGSSAHTEPETSQEEKWRRARESKQRSRLRAKGVAIPPRPGYESRTGPNRNKPSGPHDPSVPETAEARKRRLARESVQRMRLRAAGVPVPLRPGGNRASAPKI